MAVALEVIQESPTWKIVDSSKLSCFMSCPRKYFYRYVLGWQSDYPNNHLTFGTAWHLGVEHLLRNEYSKESIEEAMFLFECRYRQDFPDPESDGVYEPKSVKNAFSSLREYAKRFHSDVHEYDVLKTEIAGVVLIAHNAEMHFKLDALVRDREGKYLFIDHKTSQRKYSNWGDHWLLSTQMLLYYHVLKCLYGDEASKGIVRCSFFYKRQPSDFEESSIQKSLSQMEQWLERTQFWYDNLLTEMETLEHSSTDTTVLKAFPQNETACFNYGTQCSYWDFCNAWSNPLTRCEQVPLGFKVAHWDPREQEGIREVVSVR